MFVPGNPDINVLSIITRCDGVEDFQVREFPVPNFPEKRSQFQRCKTSDSLQGNDFTKGGDPNLLSVVLLDESIIKKKTYGLLQILPDGFATF